MKKKGKKIKSYLLPIAAFLMLSLGVQGAVVTGVYVGAPTTNALVRTGYALVSTVTLLTTNALGTMVHFMDNATASNVYTNNAYTNRVVYTTNLVNNYVTTTGVTNYFTNRVQISATTVAPAATNNLPYVAVFYVPGPNLPQVFTVDSIFARGIVISNSTAGLTISANYRGP